jgi:hypothetical protein
MNNDGVALQALERTSDMSLPSKWDASTVSTVSRTVTYSSEQGTNNISCSLTRSSGAATLSMAVCCEVELLVRPIL